LGKEVGTQHANDFLDVFLIKLLASVGQEVRRHESGEIEGGADVFPDQLAELWHSEPFGVRARVVRETFGYLRGIVMLAVFLH